MTTIKIRVTERQEVPYLSPKWRYCTMESDTQRSTNNFQEYARFRHKFRRT